VTIRIYHLNADGTTEDAGIDYTLAELGGMVPSVGDVILDPGVPQGLDRYKPENREIMVVRKRVFNPRDLQNYIALIVEVRQPAADELDMIPHG